MTAPSPVTPVTPVLLVVVCAVADVPKVQATGLKDGWGDPVLSANGLAKWGVWESALDSATKAKLAAIASVKTASSDAAANAASGWIAPAITPRGAG